MRIDENGEPTPETFIEAYTLAKQKANDKQEPVSYAGFYVTPDKPRKTESWLSRIVWILLFATSCLWAPPLLNWLFGTP